jgi:predicted ATPase/DNA-binding CsgD family transcriptional regulator
VTLQHRDQSNIDSQPTNLQLPMNIGVQRDSLIGRDREILAIRQLLTRAGVGLVTLTGPGGTGKSRLAFQILSQSSDAFPDGVHVVSLAPISDPRLVLSAIGSVLGIKEAGEQSQLEILIAYLRDRRLLLLLDNIEQVLDAASLVTDLLATCPDLKVLATGRAAFNLTVEHEFPVPPLELPRLEHLPRLEELTAIPAVALFLRRARAIQPDFKLTEFNARAVAEICARLDGLPLAIELAAARLRLLSTEALLAQLSNRLETLSGGARDLPVRQRTLRDTISWSYELLTAADQRLFRRLAPFAGEFTLNAAERVSMAGPSEQNVGGAPASPLDRIARLVEINLLKRAGTSDPTPRFEMLETIREYAQAQLEASEEAADVRQRHALYYLDLVEQTEPMLFGGESADWIIRLERDHGNIRAALQWTYQQGEADLLLRMAGALAWFWYDHGHLNEGRHWVETALNATAGEPTPAQAKALLGLGGLAHRQFDLTSARSYLESGLQMCRELGDKRGSILALVNLGLVAHDQGNYAQATQFHDECLRLSQAAGDAWGIGMSLNNLAWTALFVGDYQQAREVGERALTLRRSIGDTLGMANTLYTLGRVAQAEGDESRSRSLVAESIALFHDRGDHWGVAVCLETLAIICSQHPNDMALAARFWGASEVLRETLGSPLTPVDSRMHLRHQDNARHTLGAAVWSNARASGRTTSIDELLAEFDASSTVDPPAITGEPDEEYAQSGSDILTTRELEVLKVVAEGYTNAEAGARLYISGRTVERHLQSIYDKIGVNSRTAATRYAIDHQLI